MRLPSGILTPAENQQTGASATTLSPLCHWQPLIHQQHLCNVAWFWMANIGAASWSSSQSPNRAVQNLQPSGRHRLHIPAYIETVHYQRSCISFPTTIVQLCCLLQLVPSSYCPELECSGDGSTNFSDCWCLQELPVHWYVISSLPFLTWLLFPRRKRGLPSRCAFVFL